MLVAMVWACIKSRITLCIRTVCLVICGCCVVALLSRACLGHTAYHQTSFNRNKSSKTFSILQSDRGWYVTLSANVSSFFFSMQSSRVICRRSATEMCQFLILFVHRTSFRSKFKYNKLQFHAKVFGRLANALIAMRYRRVHFAAYTPLPEYK